MTKQPLAVLLDTFPNARYDSERRLLVWHPRGVVDDAMLDEVVAIMESEEFFLSESFDRFADLTGLTDIQLNLANLLKISRLRRKPREPARTAIVATAMAAHTLARIYEAMMRGSILQVRAFKDRELAANWLGVPLEALNPTPAADNVAPDKAA